MKNLNIITSTIMIWALALVFNLSPAIAAENEMPYEMGESGQTVTFSRTAKDESAADAEDENAAVSGNAKPKRAGIVLVVYEVGEGGHRITFPATLMNVSGEDTLKHESASETDAKSAKSDCPTVVFELAESGLQIEFQLAEDETIIEAEDILASQSDN